jgi:hypothetical protein
VGISSHIGSKVRRTNLYRIAIEGRLLKVRLVGSWFPSSYVRYGPVSYFNIKKVSKISEEEKGTCIMKLSLRYYKICFA